MQNEYAVLIPLVRTEYGDALLMEVRSELVKQPGEICFPGGRVEPGETPARTAVRETCEELGIEPEKIKLLSCQEPVVMRNSRVVYPVMARLELEDADRLGGLVLSEDEVADVFLLPVEWLRENPPAYYDVSVTPDEALPDKLRGYLPRYKGERGQITTYYWEYDGHGIWGMTAYMINRIVVGTGAGQSETRRGLYKED